jgi:hypothetical protein
MCSQVSSLFPVLTPQLDEGPKQQNIVVSFGELSLLGVFPNFINWWEINLT